MNSFTDATSAPATTDIDSTAAARQETQARRILCVDDEPNIVAALKRLFRGSGYHVATATSGLEAIAHLEREPVDLVFSDMRMPGMDGTELLAQIRARWPSTARVLLTGYADIGSTIAAINSGEVYRYITKPWDDGEVLATARQSSSAWPSSRRRPVSKHCW